MDQQFSRTALLLGAPAMDALARARVIVFGVGGVGSWCVEALARSGVGNLTIVDSDSVAPSNINRQMVALHSTVGQLKTTVMARRIRDINPHCRVHAVAGVFNEATADSYRLDDYDVIVDAIDSVGPKALLIQLGTRCRRARLVSSMGAALKTDVFAIAEAEFGKVTGDPLARALRDRFKRTGMGPSRKFRCVYSPQLSHNCEDAGTDNTANGTKRINGTLVTTTAAFGLALAQLAIRTAITILNNTITTC